MVGMSDIEIPISYVWRDTPQIYMHTQPSVEISWYSIYTFLLLESCCYWVNENTADRFQGKMPGGHQTRVVVAGFVWCPAQPTNMLPSPVNLF